MSGLSYLLWASVLQLCVRASIKWNGPNYLLLTSVIWVYIGAKGKFNHFIEDPPPKESKGFNEWKQDDFAMMT